MTLPPPLVSRVSCESTNLVARKLKSIFQVSKSELRT